MTFRLIQYPLLLVFIGLLIVDVDGCGPSIVQTIHHHHINNCNCKNIYNTLIAKINKLEKKLRGKRELAAIFDLDENDPALDLVFQHLDTKRDGTVVNDDLSALITRARRCKRLPRCMRPYMRPNTGSYNRPYTRKSPIRRPSQYSSSNNLNYCHCGRSLIDQISMDLM